MSRFARIRALILDALERPPGERAAFLDHACAGDPALRDEVASLLAQEEAARGIDAPGGLARRAVRLVEDSSEEGRNPEYVQSVC